MTYIDVLRSVATLQVIVKKQKKLATNSDNKVEYSYYIDYLTADGDDDDDDNVDDEGDEGYNRRGKLG